MNCIDEGVTPKRVRNSQPATPPPASESLQERRPSRAILDNVPDIFLSYAREDEQAIFDLKWGLQKAGFDVWFDKSALEPGQDCLHAFTL